MGDIWGSIKNTAESIGGAAVAPAAVVVDLASMPFDDKNDDFGSIMHAFATRAGDTFDPIFNPQTVTGAALSHALAGMNWAYQEGVSEPVATANMVSQHAFGGLGKLGPLGMLASVATGQAHPGDLFDGKTWSDAYERANQQQNALGASFAFGALDPNTDPLASANPYKDLQAQHGALATGLAWSGEIAGMFAGDPTFLGLKGAGALRSLSHFAKLSAADKAALYSRITESSRSGLLTPNLATRTDKYLDFINGTTVEGKKANRFGRPLSGPEILYGTPELVKYAAEPHVIAGLLADAARVVKDPAEIRNAQRRILAVAAGDTSQIARLKTEVTESASIADALTNMAQESVLDLRKLAMAPTLRTDPEFIAHLDSQLANLNKDGSVERFLDDWNGRLEQRLATSDTMPNAPGVHSAGKRAIGRQNNVGLPRAAANAHKAVDNWAAQQALKAQSASTLYQKGLYNIPVVAVKTLGFLASPYTKLPVAVTDALRQTHFTGLVNLHDWGSASTQLDSMMRLSNVSHGDRMKMLSEVFLAKTEAEKLRMIDKVEELSFSSLAREASTKFGRPEVNGEYVKTLLTEHAAKRNNARGMIAGRAYSATKMPEMLGRQGSAARLEDAGRLEAGRLGQTVSAPKRGGEWRVDQINDDGTPLALPLFETQLSNHVPLMDMDIARKLLERDNGHLSRLSRAWKQDQLELDRLAGLKGAGAKGLDKLIAAKAASIDWLVSAGQTFMRAWKFGVLFRLGYPMRVLLDDHFRIWSRIGAGTFYGGNARELGSNFRYNIGDRRAVAKLAIKNDKVRRQEILDELEADHMTAHLDRQAELRSVEASLRGHERISAQLRKEVADAETKHALGVEVDLKGVSAKLAEREKAVADKEAARAYLLEQLGDYGPTDLKAELETIEERIRGGWKALAEDKRRLGAADVEVDKGVSVQGAFAGEHGSTWRNATTSGGSFDNLLTGVEDRMYRAMSGGSQRTIGPTENGHLHAWADVLNNQMRTSKVAMHFLEGGDVESFTRWIKLPEQASLRRRVAQFAHDPEDWGGRVQAMVWDYVPSEDLQRALVSGRVKPSQLAKMFTNPTDRPAVHGRAVSDNLGGSYAVQTAGRLVNRIYKMLGEMPTDNLSRHPFFNSLYKNHAKEIYAVKRAGLGHDHLFTPEDLNDISLGARKRAMQDLRRTLFDVSAHSHAAHLMRFISPFFAAHQEGVARWWGIAADNPVVLRRYLQAFDVPRFLGVEVDQDGNPVKPGAVISRSNRILLQVPKAFGGKDTKDFQSKWTVNETSFNIILQGGLSNPGVGPIVSIPVEWAVEKYADDPSVAKVARIFSPFPPNSPFENIVPAWYKRLSAGVYGETGFDPSLIGVGKREYNSAMSQYVQDLTVDFQLKNGREPNANEAASIMEDAGNHATTQMWHRLLWNIASPTPATPQSKYAAVQQGWYRISEQARAEGKDFNYAFEQFKAKYGEAYLPLIYSTSNNPAWVDSNPATVGALKHYKGVLSKVDPALTRVVIGAYADDMIAKNATLGDYSPDARNWLRDKAMGTGTGESYYSYDAPAAAMEEQMARRGWAKYGELTAALTAMAQQAGLTSYEDDPRLVDMKRAGVAALKEQNYAFSKDYDTVDSGQFDRYLGDLKDIATSPTLANDPERTDIKTLQMYLQARDYFTQAFAARDAAGYGGYSAQPQTDLRAAFTKVVGALVESNLDFEEHIYNGLIERDPYLIQSGATQ